MIKLYILLLLAFLVSCKNNNSNILETKGMTLYPTYNNITLDRRVDSLLNGFISEVNNDSALFELHFIEIENFNEFKHRYNTIIFVATNPFKSNMSFHEGQRPLFYFLQNEHKIYLYSSLNQIIKSDEKNLNLPELNTNNWWAKKWTIDISDYEIRVIKKGGLPRVIDPDMEKEKEVISWVKSETNLRSLD